MPREPINLNARIGAWTLFVGAGLQVLLSFSSAPLAPLRLLALGILVMGAWAFVDEMGTRKPLVKAGFVAFCGAAMGRLMALIENSGPFAGRFYLLFAFAALLALFFWSVAFLHRQRDLKAVGAVGVLASLAPLAALVAGHLVLGVGAFFGIDALMQAVDGGPLNNQAAIRAIDGLILI